MSQIITPNEWIDYCNTVIKEKRNVFQNPRKQTMTLIMQFARSYHVEKQLPDHLSGMVLN